MSNQPETTFNVLIQEIQAALLFASEDDTRYILNSVCFDLKPSKAPLLVSTDGRRLCAIETTSPQAEGATLPTLQLILAASELKAVCTYMKKWCKKFDQITIRFRPSERVIFQSVLHVVEVEKGAVLSGVYPNWRAIIPTGEKEPVQDIAINSEYLYDYAAAAKLLKPKELPGIAINIYTQESAFDVVLTNAPNFYSVLMPMRPNEEVKFQPKFVLK